MGKTITIWCSDLCPLRLCERGRKTISPVLTPTSIIMLLQISKASSYSTKWKNGAIFAQISKLFCHELRLKCYFSTNKNFSSGKCQFFTFPMENSIFSLHLTSKTATIARHKKQFQFEICLENISLWHHSSLESIEITRHLLLILGNQLLGKR